MPGHYANLDQRNKRVVDEHYALVPRVDVPRSTFHRQWEHKTTGKSGFLIPILVDEVLPGDVHTARITLFARLSTLLFPLMDNAYVDTQFFFVPMRILWTNFVKFMGQQTNPADSISYTIPTVQYAPVTNMYTVTDSTYILADQMGIPVSNLAANVNVNALPFRAYNLIYNEWYRDQNIQNSLTVRLTDSGDLNTDFAIASRGKRHDYFTSALPWPLKGGVEVTLPLAGSAPISGIGMSGPTAAASPNPVYETAGSTPTYPAVQTTAAGIYVRTQSNGLVGAGNLPQVFANLALATGATINALRLAVSTQKLLERDARGGTRYTELLQMHWGVHPQDQRVQRPEYIGGGTTYIQTAAIAQTAITGATPLGGLAGQATAAGQHSYTCIGHEHGYIIGLMSLMTRPTYQNGLARLWTRSTRYDLAWPEFAALGEQIIRNDEIYATGNATDSQAFGYQERYAEYRFKNSSLAGLFRSKNAGAIDQWHLAQNFTSLPTLNATFLIENAPFSRVLAAGTAADWQQYIVDMLFDVKTTRSLPAYGIPGGPRGTF